MQQHSGSECDSCSFASPKMHITALAKDHLLLLPESNAGFGNLTEWTRTFLLSTMLAITQDLRHVRFQTQCQPTEINTGPQNSVRRIVAFNQCQKLTSALMQCKKKEKKSALSAFTQKFSVENSQRGDEQQSKLSL